MLRCVAQSTDSMWQQSIFNQQNNQKINQTNQLIQSHNASAPYVIHRSNTGCGWTIIVIMLVGMATVIDAHFNYFVSVVILFDDDNMSIDEIKQQPCMLTQSHATSHITLMLWCR